MTCPSASPHLIPDYSRMTVSSAKRYDAGRCRRTPGGPWCPSRMGTAVDDKFPSTEMPTATNHQKEISSQGVLRDTWTHTCWNSQEGQWNSSLPPAQPKQGANCSEDAHIRIPHPPNHWIQFGPRSKQVREMVQHQYARYTSRDYGRTSSVTAILKTLGLEPLAERRAKAHIIMMYIIVHGIVDILASDHIIQAPASRRNGNAQFRVPYARTLAY